MIRTRNRAYEIFGISKKAGKYRDFFPAVV